ncbi:MAG: NUDIX domain-containing protein, partial [Methylocella sp.]
ERPLRLGAAFFVRRRDGAVLVRTRPANGLLGGMTELPGTAWETDFDAASAANQAPVAAAYRKLDKSVSHAFTHFALRLDIYVAEVRGRRAPTGYRFVPDCGLDQEAFPSVMRKVIEAVRQNARTSCGKRALVRGPKPEQGKELPSRKSVDPCLSRRFQWRTA